MKVRTTLLLPLALLATAACGGGDDGNDTAQPQVIAHRGASGYLPEHTLAGYELAIRMGADFIEPDLQMSKDGVLVAMHDDTLQRTTNIASLFAPRNGGYKVADFTLAEIKTLTVLPTGTGKTSYPGFTPSAADPFKVPTFQEVAGLVQAQSSAAGRRIGLYPEAKQADLVMEDGILKALAQKDVASFSEGVGLVINAAAYPITRDYIAQAHAAGLKVHGWTFAQADATLSAAEYRKYLDMGMDGMFANYPDLGVAARNSFVKGR